MFSRFSPLTRCSVTENQINTPGGFVIKEIPVRFVIAGERDGVWGADSNPTLRTNILADSTAPSQCILNWEMGCNFFKSRETKMISKLGT